MSRYARLEELFLACVGLPPDERVAFLDAHCAGDETLRRDLERLLERDATEAAAGLTPVVDLEPAAPAVIGAYRIAEKLGEGGFGDVYAADQTAPVRRRVAIKLLRTGLDSRRVLARFEAERQTLARMDHPGIARVFDAGETAHGRPYVVMELVQGEPITAFCDRYGLGTRARIELIVAVARAVEHAHQKGVIHRDLKPSNILVTRTDGKPRPQVIDFGIAKAIGESADERTLQTRAGEFLGTPEYASPEHVESGGVDVDTRTDVYSLGVVAYRLLTGRLPFDPARLGRGNLAELARRLREAEPPRPSAIVATPPATGFAASARELAGDLDWILLRALERDRERRYPSAAALADDLERHLAELPVLAGPPGAGYRVRKFVRRHRPLVAGSLAVALALIAGLVATTVQARRAQRESEIATAVSAFLTRMVAGANPESSPGGRDVPMRVLVDRAAAELDAGAARRPDVEAGVRHAIGSTYMGLGLYEPAQLNLERAVELRTRQFGAHAAPTFESRLALAELEVRRGRYREADSLLNVLARDRRRTSDPAVRLRLLHLHGAALANLSRFGEADSLLAAALALARTRPDDPATEVALLGELAQVRSRFGRGDEAEALAREALARARAAHTPPDHAVAAAAANLAVILRDASRYAEAESLCREALAIERAALGPAHPAVAERLSLLASVVVEQGRTGEAEALHREAVRLLVAALGEGHPTVAVARNELATLLQLRGAHAEALALRLAVLESLRSQFGETHEEVANAYNNLGSVYRLLGRTAEALVAFESAATIFGDLYGPDHGTVAVSTHNAGKTLLEAGRVAEAESTLVRAVAIARRFFPADHVNTAIFESTYGRALLARGRYAEAERLLVPAHARIAAALGDDHPRTREVAGDLDTLYRRWGRPRPAT